MIDEARAEMSELNNAMQFLREDFKALCNRMEGKMKEDATDVLVRIEAIYRAMRDLEYSLPFPGQTVKRR